MALITRVFLIIIAINAITCAIIAQNTENRATVNGIATNEVFHFSRLIGGNSKDEVRDMALDSNNNIILTGMTDSQDFPTLNAYQPTSGGWDDGYVAKFSSNGFLVWSTYLGGTNYEFTYGVATDSQDNVIIVGATSSDDFPILNASNSTHSGSYDVYITKFSPTGTLIWSTVLGGAEFDSGAGVGIDPEDSIIITGSTSSPDFPLLGPFSQSYNDNGDIFVAKLNTSGALMWSTCLGGGSDDTGTDVALSSNNTIIVVGGTKSIDFPTVNGYDSIFNGEVDGFAARFDSHGALAWSTFLGGSNYDEAYDVVVDSQEAIVLTGITSSNNFPTKNAFDSACDSSDAFVTKFSSTGALVWSTFLGGNGFDQGSSVAQTARNDVVVTGSTDSSDFPTLDAYYPTHNGGGRDVFVVTFSTTGELDWGSYLGGSEYDTNGYATVDALGQIIVTGHTESADFPVTMDPIRSITNGSEGKPDIFISSVFPSQPAKNSEGSDPLASILHDLLPFLAFLFLMTLATIATATVYIIQNRHKGAKPDETPDFVEIPPSAMVDLTELASNLEMPLSLPLKNLLTSNPELVKMLGTDLAILLALAENYPSPILPSTLSERLELSRSRLSQALSKLQERDLINFRDSIVDGRMRPYLLSEKGRMLVLDLMTELEKLQKRKSLANERNTR
ncbi:MAG: SBBP repeat-containing protein [Candidatus Heimdallarchaeota archaeon]